ncbi:hypothetical protein Pan161_17400 [Gimesia algae]|uniref:Uncharacterized protein n=1 Tax=Gimesia algae TaxID=2527971 RepID=A0A517VAR6_9PLAN|nr:hypothetical protein Pan161_17400 [Gimesia algae]
MFLKFTDLAILEDLQAAFYFQQLFSSEIQKKPNGL